ncbi:hypothetical protein EBU24_03435 [bacterium]|nr:hypothetical protein [bacterium]
MKLFYRSFFALMLIVCSSSFASQKLPMLTLNNPDMHGEGYELNTAFAQKAFIKASCCAMEQKRKDLEQQLNTQLILAQKYAGKGTWINDQEVSYEQYWLDEVKKTQKALDDFYKN